MTASSATWATTTWTAAKVMTSSRAPVVPMCTPAGAGDDTMLDHGGNDSFAGDAGTDLVSFQALTTAIVADLPAGVVMSDLSHETIATVENMSRLSSPTRSSATRPTTP